MPLDFPTSPSDGDLHTDGSTTWQWRASPGLWTVVTSGVPTEIVEANTSLGWQVWGDTLIQWGWFNHVNGRKTVTFPQAFAAAPFVITSPYPGTALPAAHLYTTHVAGDTLSTTSFESICTFVFESSGTTIQQSAVALQTRWVAIGEAPASLKKPKSIQAAGGLYVQEYHDPTLAASWRVMGTTFEQWGRLLIPNGGSSAYGYAKPLASAPSVTVSAYNGSGLYAELTALSPTNFGIVTRIGSTGVTAQSWATYHVVGELA